MIKTFGNFCIRCGRPRIVVRTWKEKLDTSIIINTETACPDPECQKKVDTENKRQKDKHDAMRLRSEQRLTSRRLAKNKQSSL